MLSDLHFGELIYSSEGDTILFDTSIANMRMEDVTCQLIYELKKEKINHLYIIGIGDMVDGDSIYRNHLFRVEKSAVEQVQDSVKSISKMLNNLVDSNITIEMYNVRGNHGITNYKNLEEDNWDTVVYDMLELVFMNNKDVLIHNFKGAEGKIAVGDKNIVACHGQNIGTQIKTANGLREFRGMCSKHDLEIGDMIVVGHLHEFGIETDRGRFLLRNGSLADASEYAYKLNLYSDPMQTLMILENSIPYPKIIPLNLRD